MQIKSTFTETGGKSAKRKAGRNRGGNGVARDGVEWDGVEQEGEEREVDAGEVCVRKTKKGGKNALWRTNGGKCEMARR